MKYRTERIHFHLQFPEVTLESYTKTKQLEAFGRIRDRKRVYLDTKYWLLLRDVTLGRRDDPPILALLEALRAGVQKGTIFCPICEGTLSEIASQLDDATRHATATLVDELSLGVGLLEHDMRSNTELACLLHSDLPDERMHHCDQLVWTSTTFALGYVFPQNDSFDPKTMLCIQKAFSDYLWDLPLAKLLDAHPRKPMPDTGFASLANRLNSENASHQGELTSFNETFEIESQGTIDLMLPIAREIMRSRYRQVGRESEPVEAELSAIEVELRKLLIAVLNSPQATSRLPTMHVNTSIHAFLRWNKGQKWEANHFTDLRHAAAALGYCDAFFTERSLAGWLCHGELQLDRKYSCVVVHKVTDALRVTHDMCA
jgi:hypothetical protein